MPPAEVALAVFVPTCLPVGLLVRSVVAQHPLRSQLQPMLMATGLTQVNLKFLRRAQAHDFKKWEFVLRGLFLTATHWQNLRLLGSAPSP